MATIGVDIDKAISLLESNELVGIPTETVYGLAGNALSEEAILKIYQAKNRPKFDPLIAHIPSMEHLDNLAEAIPEKAAVLANEFWPGPLTLLLEKKDKVPDLLTSGLPRVAVRIPNHPLTLELLSKLDFPLAAPSANPFGYVSPVEAIHVNNQLGDKIDYVLDGGKCHVGLESTIVGFENEDVIIHRLGGTSVDQIQDQVGEVRLETNQSSNPAAPGMLKSHYSPGRRLILGDIEESLKNVDSDNMGIISFKKDYSDTCQTSFVLAPSGDLENAARNIFTALRQMDDLNVDVILAEMVPNEGLGLAINDRLKRAAV
jgi:L-threonylcarbamoyladenylate synthase